MICIALLLNHEIQNDLRQVSYEFNRKYDLPLTAAMLPQHVSLKISFDHDDLEEITTYVEGLSKSLDPIQVKLTEYQLIPMNQLEGGSGLIWAEIDENTVLRKLHLKINHELEKKFGVPKAPFDGENYHFHSTVCMGGKSLEVYQKAYSELTNKNFNSLTTINKIALFYSPDKPAVAGKFICYKIFDL